MFLSIWVEATLYLNDELKQWSLRSLHYILKQTSSSDVYCILPTISALAQTSSRTVVRQVSPSFDFFIRSCSHFAISFTIPYKASYKETNNTLACTEQTHRSGQVFYRKEAWTLLLYAPKILILTYLMRTQGDNRLIKLQTCSSSLLSNRPIMGQ